ncbi:MAG: hypothetical protein M3440_09540 [Chloroflexota bacterium]|nr:hypothetical protein [Chloroflexota bacterium]
MTVGFDPYVGQRFIWMKLIQHLGLAADIGTDVYKDIVMGSPTKYILMTVVNAEDLMVVGADKIWTNILWQIEYWTRANDDGVVAIGAAMIHEALHKTSGTMAGSTYGSGLVYSTHRVRALSLPPEVDGNTIWRRAGGEYRQLVQAT